MKEKINKFELIEINKKPIMRILPSSKNELKQLDIKNVLKDPNYNTESVFVNDKTLGIIWLNNNNIDCDFSNNDEYSLYASDFFNNSFGNSNNISNVITSFIIQLLINLVIY